MKNKFLKSVAVIITLILVFSTVTAPVLAASFSDLNGHWGYDYVMTLVNDGTVNGYPDGTFKPDGTVTRAEFVKLIGKSDVLYNGTYSDIEGHWGYDYIMYSGLDGYSDGTFKPDTPITRNDCVNLIWKRNGEVKDIVCPLAVTNQGTNRDAVAWAYTNGIVCGDDGFNLRLSDTLTRAEAATLIIRSRNIDPNAPKVNFIDRINPEILKAVFESYNIFGDITYNPDATITNGQLARAVLSYGKVTSQPDYGDVEAVYSGTYAKDMAIVVKECMGDVPLNAESENAPASIKHTLSEFLYHTLQRTGRLKSGTGTPYPDFSDYTGNLGLFMKYAYLNGIMFDHTGNIYPDNQITHKQLAMILLQIDELFGTQIAYKDGNKMFVKINKNLSTYSANYKEYRCLLNDVSQKVYTEFKPEASVLDYTDAAHSSASIIAESLNILKGKYNTDDYKLSFVSYPTLACEKGMSITFVAKLTANVPAGTKVSSIFPDIFYSSRDADASNGDVYLVFKTTEPMIKFYFEPEELQLIDVIS